MMTLYSCSACPWEGPEDQLVPASLGQPDSYVRDEDEMVCPKCGEMVIKIET